MTFLLFCSLIAAAFIAAHCLMPRYPKLRCALYGHEEKIDPIPVCGTMKWRCVNCGKEVVL